MKKILILLFTLITIQSHGAEEGFHAGGESGWINIRAVENAVFIEGKGGYQDIILKSSMYIPDNDTDMLIHFDSGFRDETGRYRLTGKSAEITSKLKSLGSGCGVFLSTRDGVSYSPDSASLFAPGNILPSFSLEFWLNPVLLKDGEEIVSFRSSVRDRKGTIIPQRLSCSVKNRKLSWEFENFFFNPGTYRSSVSVQGYTSLIPEKWHHHLLTYNSSSGLIEYYVDGMLEGITYATATGKDNMDPLVPVIGSLASGTFSIGRNYHGFLDEFRISKRVVDNPVLSRFQNSRGKIETALIDMGRNGSLLNRIVINTEAPGNSALQYYYKVFKDFGHTVSNDDNWLPFMSGDYFKADNMGRFFKIRIDMFPDGEGTESPVVHSIYADYRKNLPPLAPEYLTAVPGDGQVSLSWQKTGEPDIRGYLIYYGTKSGVYLGTDGEEGHSPITVGDVSSFTIHNLKNGTLYYFAVAAYDTAGKPYPGALSEEKSSRPLPGLGRDN